MRRQIVNREEHKTAVLKIFSDGGCIGNPGPGGWAAIVVRDGHFTEFGGSEAETTNNRMEMTGAIRGLEATRAGEAALVVTDSRYVVDGATKWIWGWKKKGWIKADGNPVLNRDLWERIDELCRARKVKWEHVRGHAGHPENERCDEIANGFARGVPPELKTGDGAWIFENAKAPPGAQAKAKKPKTEKEAAVDDSERYQAPLYLSIVGGDVAEHGTWPECEARIKGIKGARCKKVTTRAEHIAALVAWGDVE